MVKSSCLTGCNPAHPIRATRNNITTTENTFFIARTSLTALGKDLVYQQFFLKGSVHKK